MSEIMRFLVPRTWKPSTLMEQPSAGRRRVRAGKRQGPGGRDAGGWCTPRRLQETGGCGRPVAMHYSTAIWCTVTVRF